jgi:hypothetical protein
MALPSISLPLRPLMALFHHRLIPFLQNQNHGSDPVSLSVITLAEETIQIVQIRFEGLHQLCESLDSKRKFS